MKGIDCSLFERPTPLWLSWWNYTASISSHHRCSNWRHSDSPNSKFQHWHVHDQMILSAIISSLCEKILTHVVKCTTSRDVWHALECMFISHSREQCKFIISSPLWRKATLPLLIIFTSPLHWLILLLPSTNLLTTS